MPPETATASHEVAANDSIVAPATAVAPVTSPPAIEVDVFLNEIGAQLRESSTAIAANDAGQMEMRGPAAGLPSDQDALQAGAGQVTDLVPLLADAAQAAPAAERP